MDGDTASYAVDSVIVTMGRNAEEVAVAVDLRVEKDRATTDFAILIIGLVSRRSVNH